MADGGGRVVLCRDGRSRTHVLVRSLGNAAPVPTNDRAPADLFSDLMMARTPSELVGAAEALGPLRLGVGAASADVLLLDAAGMRGILAQGVLTQPVAPLLVDELCFDPLVRHRDGEGFEPEGRRPYANAQELAGQRGLDSPEAVLGGLESDGLFEIEPLQDWVLARNLISIAARLLGVTRIKANTGNGAGVLERAGFTNVESTEISGWGVGLSPGAWATPLLSSAIFGQCAVQPAAVPYPWDVACPLLVRITDDAGSLPGGARKRPLAGSDGASVVAPPTDRCGTGDGRWAYLVLEGGDQDAVADGLLLTLDGLLGTGRVGLGGYESASVPVTYDDAPARLWATLLRHDRRFLMTCRYCGRTVLASGRGMPREFCSATCRASANNHVRPLFLT